MSERLSLVEVLATVPDPRFRRGRRHPLTAILSLAVVATLAGSKSLEAIAQFASPELRTTTQFVGPLSVVDATLADHAEAVVREAVSNAIRHGKATTLSVSVTVEDDLVIEVVDNGSGISGEITGSGLANLQKRAQDVGGSFAIESVADQGTTIRWSAPL